MKKWKIIAIGSTIILPLMLGLIFIVAISALLQVVISGTSNDGDGVITRQTAGSSYYYDAYKKVLKQHLSIKTNTTTKGYVTLSRTVLFYSILMDNYCQNKVSGALPNYKDDPTCEVYDKLYKDSCFSKRLYSSVLKPINNDDIDVAYAKLVFNKDPIALAKFNEAYELNLDENFRMSSISQACENLSNHLKTDFCSNANVKSYIDELLKSKSESDSTPSALFSYPLGYGVGVVTSLFNVQRNISASNGVSSKGVHSGWDIGASANTSVYSVCDGVVTSINNSQKTNTSGGDTNYVIIKCDAKILEDEYNNDIEIRYWHLYPDSIKVRVGERVYQGDHIAGVGTTGNSTGNHLHLQAQFVNDPGRKLDAFYYIDWSIYFQEFLDKDKNDDVEYTPFEEETDDDSSTSFDDELEEKDIEEQNKNDLQQELITKKNELSTKKYSKLP